MQQATVIGAKEIDEAEFGEIMTNIGGHKVIEREGEFSFA